MDMYDSIKNFNTQFAYEPKIENQDGLRPLQRVVVAGMGGSNLAAGLVKIWKPELDIVSHRDYGLPVFQEKARDKTFVIASSYSGNTEETIDAFQDAGRVGMPRAAISVGGKLLELAKKEKTPYVQMPDTGIQPRMATGYSIMALLKLLGEERALKELGELSLSLQTADYEEKGKALAERLRGYVPVIYSSLRNQPIAYNWKIKFNETGKTPAFTNAFPELNHNEMTGFDTQARTDADLTPHQNKFGAGQARTSAEEREKLNAPFHFIFLHDPEDHPKIQKRVEVTGKLYRDRGLRTETLELDGSNIFEKIFSSLIFADWAAYYTAKAYGNDPNEVPMVEEFKKLI